MKIDIIAFLVAVIMFFLALYTAAHAAKANFVTTTTYVSSRDNYEYKPESIGKPFDKQHWYNASPQYTGWKDDYNPNQFRNDPEVLVSLPRNSPAVTEEQVKETSNKSTVQQLDADIRRMTYDSTPKTFSESLTPEEVADRRTGNCFEIARYAYKVLWKAGYTAVLINLKLARSDTWHTVCVFKELDGRWSLFQAAGYGHMGYFPGHSDDLKTLLKDQFLDIVDFRIIG
jgi:hypothetical protein